MGFFAHVIYQYTNRGRRAVEPVSVVINIITGRLFVWKKRPICGLPRRGRFEEKQALTSL